MKLFKRFAIILAVALATVCMGVVAAACDNDTKNTEATEFTITVYYSDGTTVVDGTKDPLVIQICLENDKVSFCSTTTSNVDANGKAKFNIAAISKEADNAAAENGETLTDSDKNFVLHVLKSGVGQLALTEEVHVSKANPDVKMVLKDVVAP